MADASRSGNNQVILLTLVNAVGAGEVWQMPDGRAGFLNRTSGASASDQREFSAGDKVTMTKAAGFVAIAGNRAYWDHSANAITYRKNGDRDFYVGRFAADATSAATTCSVFLNIDPKYDFDSSIDPFDTVIVGTQALGGLGLYRRGGAHKLILDATNEAQKVDILGKDGFSINSKPFIEFGWEVVSDGAGTAPDFNIGIANGTDASDADSITESVFIHLNGNEVNIYAESDDGTVEVAATDTTIGYTEGTRVEGWIDVNDNGDVQIYINGSLVLSATVFDISTATGPLFPLVHLEKTAATDTYEIDVDWFRVRLREQGQAS